jgi:hypothetical protein
VAGQQEVGDALLDGILMPTASTNEFSLGHLSLEEEMVKILESLVITLELNCGRSLLRELREPKLRSRRAKGLPVQTGKHVDNHVRIQLNVVLDEFCILGVKGIRVLGRLAGLDGAGEEVETKDLHFVGL